MFWLRRVDRSLEAVEGYKDAYPSEGNHKGIILAIYDRCSGNGHVARIVRLQRHAGQR